jgi:hypothetical protein
MDAVPPAAARKMKKKRKVAAPAAPAAAFNNVLTATPMPATMKGKTTRQEESCQAYSPLRNTNVGKDDQQRKSLHRSNGPWAEVGCRQHRNHQW